MDNRPFSPHYLVSLFPNVVSGHVSEMIMTPIDQDRPTIADAFFERLFQGSDGKPALEPDTTKPAQALHFAVKKLRS